MRHKIPLLVALALATAVTADCGGAKLIGKTVEDAASLACQATLADDAKAQGLNIDDLCKDYNVLKPFIDAILASKGKAAMRAGLKAPAADGGLEPDGGAGD